MSKAERILAVLDSERGQGMTYREIAAEVGATLHYVSRVSSCAGIRRNRHDKGTPEREAEDIQALHERWQKALDTKAAARSIVKGLS